MYLLRILFCYINLHLCVYGYKNTRSNSFFNNWICIGLKQNIDFTKPYPINIGKLPLVMWKDVVTNKLITTINICKHMGSKLDNGLITNGCLKCSYHGLEMSNNDRFGETVEHEGKIFWAYKPTESIPYKMPYYHHPDYVKSYITFDMEASLKDSAFNTMDIRHPEFVHKTGFGSSIPPINIKQYKYCDNLRVGVSFDYSSNRIMQSLNENTHMTNNFNMFIYPATLWNRASFGDNHLLISVNLLPLEEKKTRWFVTIAHNYYKTDMQMKMMKMLASGILIQDFHQMRNQHIEDELKNEMMFDYKFKNEEVIHWLHDMFKEYKYPDSQMCADLYRDYKNDRCADK